MSTGITPTQPSGSALGTPQTSRAHQRALTKVDMKQFGEVAKLSQKLNDTNWVIWRENIVRFFDLAGITPVVFGTLLEPDETTHRDEYEAWTFNDSYAQVVITKNLDDSQILHVARRQTSNEMWTALRAIHEVAGHQTAIAVQRALFRTLADEGEDVIKHLTKLKKLWECLISFGICEFNLSDVLFKGIIASSLPPSWDIFTEPYVGILEGEDPDKLDEKKKMSLQSFIGVIKMEYLRRKDRIDKTYITKVPSSS